MSPKVARPIRLFRPAPSILSSILPPRSKPCWAAVTFAGRMLALAADLLESAAPEEAALCARAADARTELHAALAEARVEYIGEDPHSSESRLNRFLRRLADN